MADLRDDPSSPVDEKSFEKDMDVEKGEGMFFQEISCPETTLMS